MNYQFEQDFISKIYSLLQGLLALELIKDKGALNVESLEILRGKTLAIDASLMVQKVVI